MRTLLSRLSPDPYIAGILGMVVLASLMPAHGSGMAAASGAGTVAIALIFFLQGARLGPRAALAGARHWRLHATVLGSTFLVFPVLGLTARAIAPGLLTPPLWAGLLLLCVLPSTVQSSIAFTSIASGNVAAALCAATASNLLGILLTPLLAGLLLSTTGGFSARGVGTVVLQLLLPFAAGQLARPWIGDWVGRNRRLASLVDRGSILLVVYVAFSEGVTHGIWHQLDAGHFAALLLLDAALLAAVLLVTTGASRLLGFDPADRITVVFCGSKKSLASGLPMAGVLFAGQSLGLVVLPLMLFHQLQLMVCAALARRYAAGATPDRGERAQSRSLLRNSMTSPFGPVMKAIRTSAGGSPPSVAVRGATREIPPAASARA
jgi:solute carrier family 10 (sodium/bile acid cotransporter), member 7